MTGRKINYSQIFEDFVKSNCEILLTPYVSSTEKVEIRCKHNHIFTVSPRNYKSGRGCPKCSGQCPEQAKEQFERLVKENGDELLTPYLNARAKSEIRCKRNHIFRITASSYKSGRGCPKCVGLCPEQTKEQFERLIKENGDELLTPYRNAITKLEIRCKNNHIFKIIPRSYKSGRGCPKCVGLCPEQAKEQFERLVKESGDELLTPYLNVKTKVEILCKHNHLYKVSPNNYRSGTRCPICAYNHGIKHLYILKDTSDKRIAKVGVSLNPWRRCEEIQKKSSMVYPLRHNFEVFKQWDLSLEPHQAVDIESEILRKFSDIKFYTADEKPFDGSSEILLLSPEELEKEVLHFW